MRIKILVCGLGLLAGSGAGAERQPPQGLTLAAAQAVLFSKAPELRAEELAVARSRAQLTEARSGYLPSLDVFGSYTAFSEANHLQIELPPPIGAMERTLGDKTREEYGIDLTIPLFAGGQRHGQVRSRRAAVTASAEAVRARRNQLSLRLAALYFAWNQAEASRATQEAIVRAQEDSYRRTASEVRQGAALKSREAAARARWLGAQVDLHDAIDRRDSLARAASLLLGLSPEAPFAFAIDTARAPEEFPDRAQAAPGEVRPELVALDRTAESLEFQEKSLTGARLPSLAAVAGYRLANPGLNLGSDEYMSYGLIGVQLRWNLFDGARNRSQRLAVRSQRDAVTLERERQASVWSEAALSSERQIARLNRTRLAAEAAREAAREGLRERTAQKKQGSASETEWIDATVQDALADLRVRQLDLQIRLAIWQQKFARGETLVFSQGEAE